MRVRIRFAKVGKVRWTSHRDVARMWERAFRRAALPLAVSGGFTPRPKISFGLALPTGHESVAEYIDATFVDSVDVVALPARLSPLLPVGVDALCASVVSADEPSLQKDVTSCTWQIEALGAAVDDRLLEGLARDTLVITRQRKGAPVTEDVRGQILSAAVDGPVECPTAGHEPGSVIIAELATHPRSLRPSELLAALCLEGGHVRRTHQWITRDGARWEPIPLDATDAPHAEVRAS